MGTLDLELLLNQLKMFKFKRNVSLVSPLAERQTGAYDLISESTPHFTPQKKRRTMFSARIQKL